MNCKNRCWIVFWICAALCTVSEADMMIMEGVDTATTTTGDLLDNTDHIGQTVETVEIPGLLVTARSGSSTGIINTTSSSLGINADGAGDDTDAFDAGESMIISFNQDVLLTLFDFNLFDDGDSFTLTIEGLGSLAIVYDDLSNKLTDQFETNLVVAADTEIEFATSSPTPIGLDGIGLDIIPEPTALGLIAFTGLGALIVRRCKQ